MHIRSLRMAKLAPEAAAQAAVLVAALRAGESVELLGVLGRCVVERPTDRGLNVRYAVADEGTLERFVPGLPEAAWELLEVSDRPVVVEDEAGRAVYVETDPFAAHVIRGIGGSCVVRTRSGVPELRVRFDRQGRFSLLEG